MKVYLRLLSFSKPIEKFAIPYIIATLLTIIFGTLNLTLLVPLFETLMSKTTVGSTSITETATSAFDITAQFKDFVNNSIANNGQMTTLTYVCIVIVCSVLLSNIFRYLSLRYMEDLKVHTLLNIRRKVFNNVMDLHIGFFNNERKGDIMSKVASDVQVVQYTVTNTLQVVFKEPLTMIFYILVLLSISVKLTLFSLLVIPISGILIGRIVKRIKKQATEAHQSFAKMLGFLDEALSGIKIIKAFNGTEKAKHKFDQENIFYSNLNRKMVRRQQLASPVSEFLGVLMVSIIVWYGGNLIVNNAPGALSTSQFIGYIAIFSQVMRPAKALTDSFSSIHTGIAAGERVLELLDTKSELIDQPNAKVVTEFTDNINFKNVSFFHGENKVLNNINLTIKKGQNIALVGPSGGGKSTLMDLIPRFYDPKEGVISLDSANYKELNTNSIRANMGIVNQESFLFNDTIFNNIAFGNDKATEEEVIAAAKIANAHDFILNTENAYQTVVGDRGNKLSGGQRQRICIARAVLTNPPIMLLDEATSALDTESEKLVQEALNNLMKNRTSLVIAHRLSTIQHADKIIVLDKGEIVEQGTHAELLELKGLYFRLIEMQTFTDV